jgi:hypothetical protein
LIAHGRAWQDVRHRAATAAIPIGRVRSTANRLVSFHDASVLGQSAGVRGADGVAELADVEPVDRSAREGSFGSAMEPCQSSKSRVFYRLLE